MVWGLFGFYTAAIVILGVVVVGNANVQKADDIVAIDTWSPH